MPQLNLTTLSGHELRQRLDYCRARGDATVAYEILQEMATRRAANVERRRFGKRRKAEPHMVEIELGDPMDKANDDDLPPLPNWRAPSELPAVAVVEPPPEPPEPSPARRPKYIPIVAAVAPTEPQPEPEPAPLEEPLRLGPTEPSAPPGADDDAAPLDLRLMPPPRAEASPRRSVPNYRVAAGFVLGALSGVALGWWAAGSLQASPVAAPALEIAAASVPQAAPAPDTLPVSVEPAAPIEAANASTASVDVAASLPAEPSDPAPDHATPEPETAPTVLAIAPPAPERPVATAASGCASAPTPADREICSDPALQELQRELRQAYAEALDAHEDRALLRQRQLAWRDARNTVSDPRRLAQLYEQRIHRLQAATAEARSMR